MKKILYLSWFSFWVIQLPAQNYYNDYDLAKEVCNTAQISIPLLYDTGQQATELYDYTYVLKETHIIWLKLQIADAGSLRFEIIPMQNADGQYEDFDFALFRGNVPLAYSCAGPAVRGKNMNYCVN
ncbi:MAG: hypothetical protein ACOYOA_16780, partial [Saprospiraceae bacterium]